MAIVAVVAGVWFTIAQQPSNSTESTDPSDEEKILTLANEDEAASDYQLTATTVIIKKRVADWIYTRITYRSSVSNTISIYPVVLYRDGRGGFSIVVGFNDSTTRESLAAQHVPDSIIGAIQQDIPVPNEMEDGYE